MNNDRTLPPPGEPRPVAAQEYDSARRASLLRNALAVDPDDPATPEWAVDAAYSFFSPNNLVKTPPDEQRATLRRYRAFAASGDPLDLLDEQHREWEAEKAKGHDAALAYVNAHRRAGTMSLDERAQLETLHPGEAQRALVEEWTPESFAAEQRGEPQPTGQQLADADRRKWEDERIAEFDKQMFERDREALLAALVPAMTDETRALFENLRDNGYRFQDGDIPALARLPKEQRELYETLAQAYRPTTGGEGETWLGRRRQFVAGAWQNLWHMAWETGYESFATELRSDATWAIHGSEAYENYRDVRRIRRELLAPKLADLGPLANPAMDAAGIVGYMAPTLAMGFAGKVAQGARAATALRTAAAGSAAAKAATAAKAAAGVAGKVGAAAEKAYGAVASRLPLAARQTLAAAEIAAPEVLSPLAKALTPGRVRLAAYAMQERQTMLDRIAEEGGDVSSVAAQALAVAAPLAIAWIEDADQVFAGEGSRVAVERAKMDAYAKIVSRIPGRVGQYLSKGAIVSKSAERMGLSEAAKIVGKDVAFLTFYEALEEAAQQTIEEVAVESCTRAGLDPAEILGQGWVAFYSSLGPMLITMGAGTGKRAQGYARGYYGAGASAPAIVESAKAIRDAHAKAGTRRVLTAEEEERHAFTVSRLYGAWARATDEGARYRALAAAGLDDRQIPEVMSAFRDLSAAATPAQLADLFGKGAAPRSAAEILSSDDRIQGLRLLDDGTTVERDITMPDGKVVTLRVGTSRAAEVGDISSGSEAALSSVSEWVAANPDAADALGLHDYGIDFTQTRAENIERIKSTLGSDADADAAYARAFAEIAKKLSSRGTTSPVSVETDKATGHVTVHAGITLANSAEEETAYHEYGHAIEAALRTAGNMTEEQVAAFREAFGAPEVGRETWNEERGAVRAESLAQPSTPDPWRPLRSIARMLGIRAAMREKAPQLKDAMDVYLLAYRTGRFDGLGTVTAAKARLREKRAEAEDAAKREAPAAPEAPADPTAPIPAAATPEGEAPPSPSSQSPALSATDKFESNQPLTSAEMAEVARALDMGDGREATRTVLEGGWRWSENAGAWTHFPTLENQPVVLAPRYFGADGKWHDTRRDGEQRYAVASRVTPEEDAAYMDAVSRGDMETAQRMVREAAAKVMPDTKVVDEDGLPKVVYHGTGSGGFYTFNADEGGIWLTDSERYSRQYSHVWGAERPQTYELFANIEKPKDLRSIDTDAFVAKYRDDETGIWEPTEELVELAKTSGLSPERLVQIAEEHGEVAVDGEHLYTIIRSKEFQDHLKQQGFDGIVQYEENGMTETYCAFSPSQVKTVSAVTYDDAGNVIPLSQRFNPAQEDIRYSVGTRAPTPEFAMDGTIADALPAHLREDARAVIAERANSPLWMAEPDGSPTLLSERDWLAREARYAFSPSQVKSATDNTGVFSARPDVRYSVTPAEDAAYMDAVRRGDMETAQRMVREAAERAMPYTKVVGEDGLPKVVYHGTPKYGFTVFRENAVGSTNDPGAYGRGYYFTEIKDDAEGYKKPGIAAAFENYYNNIVGDNAAASNRTTTAGVYEVFLNIRNPKIIRSREEGAAFRKEFRIFPEDNLTESEKEAVQKEVAKESERISEDDWAYDEEESRIEKERALKARIQSESLERLRQAYDGVIVIRDGVFKEIVAFQSAQIKSADPVTYDDAGNVIPLSQRFNTEKEDIRYSISGLYTGSAADYAERVPVLDKDGNVTGYRIDNGPSLQHVGSGEGNQAFGWGLYGSRDRSVAEDFYAKNDVARKSATRPSAKMEIFAAVSTIDPAKYPLGPSFPDARYGGYRMFTPQEYVANIAKNNGWDTIKTYEALRAELSGYMVKQNKRDFLRECRDWMENEFGITKKRHRNAPLKTHVLEQTFFSNRTDGEGTERHLLQWYGPVGEERIGWIREQWDKERDPEQRARAYFEKEYVQKPQRKFDFRRQEWREDTYLWQDYGATVEEAWEARKERLVAQQARISERMDAEMAALRPSNEGRGVYTYIARILGSDKEASDFLYRAGIDGVVYPTRGRRGAVDLQSKDFNVVAFRDDNIRVDHKWTDGVQRYSIAPIPSAFDPGRLPRSMKWGTLHGHDGNIVGLVAMSRLVGKRLTNDEISDLAQRLGVEMSAKEIRDKARDLADSEIGALALGRAANGDMAGGMAILAGTAEPPSTDRELVDAAFRAGAKRGMAADAMRRKVTADVLAAQRGADLSEIVREFGFDVAKMLHSWEIEAEKRPEGAKPLDTLPNPYDFAGAMEDPDGTKGAAHEARVAEARRIAAERFSALFDEARRMQEYREEVDAETAGKSGGGTGGDDAASDAAGDDPGDLPEPFRPEALPIPAELIAQTGLDIRDAATFALALRVGIRDMVWRADPTHEGAFGAGLSGDRLDDADYEFWRNPAALDQYRKSMVAILLDMADKLLDHNSTAYRRAREAAVRIRRDTTADRIESDTADVLRTISSASIRQTTRALVADTRTELQKKFIDRTTTLDSDYIRKMTGAVQRRARYIHRVLGMTEGQVAAELDRLERELSDRSRLYEDAVKSGTATTLTEEEDQRYREALWMRADLEAYGGTRYLLPGAAKERCDEIKKWMQDSSGEWSRRLVAFERDMEKKRGIVLAAVANTVADENGKPRDVVHEKDSAADERYYRHVALLDQRLRDIFRFAQGDKWTKADALRDEWQMKVARATETYETRMQRLRKAFEDAVVAVVGRDGAADWLRHMEDEIPEEQAARLSREGRRHLTYGQVLHLYGYLCQTGDYSDNIHAHGRDGQRDYIEREVLTKEDIDIFSRLRAIYADERDELSEAKRRQTGIGFGAPDPWYAPVKPKQIDRDGAPVETSTWDLMPDVFQERRKHGLDVDETQDALALFWDRAEKGSRMIAYGDLGIEMLHVLCDARVKAAIKRFHGKTALDGILAHVGDTLAGGHSVPGAYRGQDVRWLSRLRTAVTHIALCGNLSPALKQTVSSPVFALSRETGLGSVLRDMLAIATPGWKTACREWMESDGFKARYGAGGVMGEIKDALTAGRGVVTRWQRLLALGYAPIQIGDMIPSILVGVSVYRAERDRLLKMGMDEAAARRDAATRAFLQTEATQQSSRVENQTALVRRGDVGIRLFTMFRSASVLQLSWQSQRARELRAAVDPEGAHDLLWCLAHASGNERAEHARKKFVESIVVNNLVIPPLMQLMASLFAALLGKKPDEKDALALGAGVLLGAGNALPFVAYAVWTALGVATEGKSHFYHSRQSTAPSLFGTADRLLATGGITAWDLLTFDLDAALDDADRFLQSSASPYRHVRQAVENWTD